MDDRTTDLHRNTEALHRHAPLKGYALLQGLVAALGCRRVALLLGVSPVSVGNCLSRQAEISKGMARRIIDLHDVVMHALQIFAPSTAVRWLEGSEPFLDDERPIDVLTARGATPLIEALDDIMVGAYA